MPTAMLHPDQQHRILLQAGWNDRDLIRLVPGARFSSSSREWTVPLTWASCMTLRGVFGDDLKIGLSLNEWARAERDRRVAPAMSLRDAIHLDSSFDLLRTDRVKDLYPFQQAGVAWLLAAESGLLADDMGTGKTIEILTTIRERLTAGDPALPAIVICPNSVKSSWAKEAGDWLPEATSYVVAGTPAVRNRTITAAAADPSALLIVNFEALRTLSRQAHYGSIRLKRCRECDPRSGDPALTPAKCQVHPRVLNTIEFVTLVVDEAHRIKDAQSQQTRAVWALTDAPSVRWRYGATGTPIANDPSDLWPIMRTVAPQEYPTKSAFVDRYCLQSWTPWGTLNIVGVLPATRKELYSFLDPRMRRMPKDLVLPQLPPKVRQIHYVDLPPKHRREYDAIARDFMLDRGDEMVLTPSQLEHSLRLMQFASSAMEVDGQRYRMTEPSWKIDELIEILAGLPGDTSVVFSAEHRQLIELASTRLDKLGLRHGLITGAQSPEERDQALADFQSGKTRLLGFTLKAGGTGLTMTRASVMVCLQRSWSMIDNLQGEDRVHRIGSEQHSSVTIIDVVARGTIEDERQIPALHDKFLRLEEIRRDRDLRRSKGLDESDLIELQAQIEGSHL